MESVIRDYISRELVSDPGLLPIQDDTSLLETGILDSLSLLRLLVFLEDEFSVQIDDFDLVPENFTTVDIICAFIRSHQQLKITE